MWSVLGGQRVETPEMKGQVEPGDESTYAWHGVWGQMRDRRNVNEGRWTDRQADRMEQLCRTSCLAPRFFSQVKQVYCGDSSVGKKALQEGGPAPRPSELNPDTSQMGGSPCQAFKS